MKRRKPILISIAMIALLLPMLGRTAESGQPLRQAQDRPNIILVLADDLGYGDVGAYGCRDIQTPNIDQLAESGIRLTDGYVTHPFCGPSRAGLMTGRVQQRCGFRKNPSIQPKSRGIGLDADEETLGDILTRAGYLTAAFGKWHLGASEVFHPNNRGFLEFYGFLSGGHYFFPMEYPEKMVEWANLKTPPVTELYGYATPLEINGIDLPPQEGYLTDLLTTRAISFMKRSRQNPFFLYMAYNAPHVPLEAPEEYLRKYSHIQNKNRRKYAAMVDNLDWNVGRLLAALDEQGKRKNTLVVFLSDNGGPLHNGASNGPLRGAKGSVTEGGVRVPFIFNWPGHLPSGKELDVPISSLDLLPTFAALAGVSPSGKPLDGVDVWPWLQGRADGIPHQQLFWENSQAKHQMGMRKGEFKLFRLKENEPWKLFNLAEDVGEKNNLSQQMPEKVKALAAECTAWWGRMPPERWDSPME